MPTDEQEREAISGYLLSQLRDEKERVQHAEKRRRPMAAATRGKGAQSGYRGLDQGLWRPRRRILAHRRKQPVRRR